MKTPESIFAEHAFESRYCNTADSHLGAIGRDIVQKCSELPGTTKALGVFLQSRPDPEEWEKVLKHNLWYSSRDKTDILMTVSSKLWLFFLTTLYSSNYHYFFF